MAIFKIVKKPYDDWDSVEYMINYIYDPEKTESGYRGGLSVIASSAEDVIMQFMAIKEFYHKTDGKQVKHFVVSFSDYCHLKPYQIFAMGRLIAAYYADEFQIAYALHENTFQPHLHFVVNTVSYRDGKKFDRGIGDFYRFDEYIKMITNLPHLTARVMEDDYEIE